MKYLEELVLEDQQAQECLRRTLNWKTPTEKDIRLMEIFLRKQKLKKLEKINEDV